MEQVLPVCSRAALNDDTPTGLGGVEIGGHTSGGGRWGAPQGTRKTEWEEKEYRSCQKHSDYRDKPEQFPNMLKKKEYSPVKITR